MIACPVCRHEASEAPDDLRKCTACGHVFQHPPLVQVRYNARYLATYASYPTREMSLLRIGFLKAFVNGGRLLDVGYGTGAFVRAAEEAGFHAFGSDLHQVPCNVPEINIDEDKSLWDVVTFFDSLEHFADFETVRRLLARARHVLVSLPLAPPGFPWERHWKHYKPGEHLHFFTAESLQKLIGKPLRKATDLEDVIRGRVGHRQNVYTAFYGQGEEGGCMT
jgi:hypothetical protein